MKLSFTKSKDGGIILTIYREDGSEEWSKLRRGLEDHDVAHYVVEDHLSLKEGFYGMINGGIKITDFESKDTMPAIPDIAKSIEFLVNLLQTDKQYPIKNEEFHRLLAQSLEKQGLPGFDTLTNDKLNEIKEAFATHSACVANLETGASIYYEIEV